MIRDTDTKRVQCRVSTIKCQSLHTYKVIICTVSSINISQSLSLLGTSLKLSDTLKLPKFKLNAFRSLKAKLVKQFPKI